MLSVNRRRAWLVEWCYLKPNWLLHRIENLSRKQIILLYINFSINLLNIDSKEIGLQLDTKQVDPFLWIGTTVPEWNE